MVIFHKKYFKTKNMYRYAKWHWYYRTSIQYEDKADKMCVISKAHYTYLPNPYLDTYINTPH